MAIKVENMKTGEIQIFTCPSKEAVVCAYAQEHNDWNTWDYQKNYSELLHVLSSIVQCGDWVALTEEFAALAKGKVYCFGREILGTNQLYVEGYGWISERKYQYLMYQGEGASLFSKIKQRNIQYQTPTGRMGQMDIDEKVFWDNRLFVPDK